MTSTPIAIANESKLSQLARLVLENESINKGELQVLNNKSRELDGQFQGRELGEHIAGVGRIRTFENYQNFLERHSNSLDAVRTVQWDMADTVNRIVFFIDSVIKLSRSDSKIAEFINKEDPKSTSFSTSDGYSFTRGIDENKKTWYEFKAPNFQYRKYWQQAKHDDDVAFTPGGWIGNSMIHSVKLTDPSSQENFLYEIGNRDETLDDEHSPGRYTKLLGYKAKDELDKPSTDELIQDSSNDYHRYPQSLNLNLHAPDFYKR